MMENDNGLYATVSYAQEGETLRGDLQQKSEKTIWNISFIVETNSWR